MMKISLRVEVFKEGDVYVALSPELNVSRTTADISREHFFKLLEKVK